jgi:acyl-CoA thioesterase
MDEKTDTAAWAATMKRLYKTSPIHNLLGMALEEIGDGSVTVGMTVKPEYVNAMGMVHGGIITTGLDSALLQAVRTRCGEGDHQATIELKVNFLEPARSEKLRFRGISLRVGRSVGVAQAEALDEAGKCLAAAQGTISIRRKQ